MQASARQQVNFLQPCTKVGNVVARHLQLPAYLHEIRLEGCRLCDDSQQPLQFPGSGWRQVSILGSIHFDCGIDHLHDVTLEVIIPKRIIASFQIVGEMLKGQKSLWQHHLLRKSERDGSNRPHPWKYQVRNLHYVWCKKSIQPHVSVTRGQVPVIVF